MASAIFKEEERLEMIHRTVRSSRSIALLDGPICFTEHEGRVKGLRACVPFSDQASRSSDEGYGR